MIIEEVTYSIYQFKLILPFVILKRSPASLQIPRVYYPVNNADNLPLSGYTPGREIDSKDNA